MGSLVLHGGIVAATLFFAASRTLDIVDQSPPVIPIDIVTIAQKTNIRATSHRTPKVAPTPVPPAPKAMLTPPVPQPKAEPAPAPEKPPIPKAEPIEKPEPAPIVPKLRPKPVPKEEDKKNFDVDKVLALLNKVAPSQAAAPNAPEAARTVHGFGAQNAMTADLQDALRSQIQPCWSPPVGAPHPERLVVTFDLFLNPDGSVARPPQLLASSSDPYFNAAKEAALRAIYTCAPYKLPADRYEQWREINPFIFDPRQMMGQ
ncbi:MAG TPA: cell envelope integrity protein TolA [Rhizomicrobium sp.]